MMKDENSYWYCQTCDQKLDGEEVTFEELHDPVYGGCGFKVVSRSCTPNRPPSCDLLQPKLKECPFCGSNDVELRDGYDLDEINQYVRCNNCEADGPWLDDNAATKWNSIPRRSEVEELIRLVDWLKHSQSESEEFPKALHAIYGCADKLRKEMGE